MLLSGDNQFGLRKGKGNSIHIMNWLNEICLIIFIYLLSKV